MATDKSINMRQTQATESIANALIEMQDRLKAIQKQLDEIYAVMIAAGEFKPGKLETASRSASARK